MMYDYAYEKKYKMQLDMTNSMDLIEGLSESTLFS